MQIRNSLCKFRFRIHPNISKYSLINKNEITYYGLDQTQSSQKYDVHMTAQPGPVILISQCYMCVRVVITFSRLGINRVRKWMPILLMVTSWSAEK